MGHKTKQKAQMWGNGLLAGVERTEVANKKVRDGAEGAQQNALCTCKKLSKNFNCKEFQMS